MNTIPPSSSQMLSLRLSGCLAIILLLFMGCILPWMLLDLATTALHKLHLSPPMAILVLVGMLFGSVINIPVFKLPSEQEVVVRVFEPVGGWSVYPQRREMRHEIIVAVNVGGCVIPLFLGFWLLSYIIDAGTTVMVTLLVGILLNVSVCYYVAKPILGIGIVLPVFIPTLISLSVAWLALGAEQWSEIRAPVAFLVGITGPIVGADLLHWRQFRSIGSGIVSIGGAGTWDGIVLCGLLSALLA